jgi:hypothetical protein
MVVSLPTLLIIELVILMGIKLNELQRIEFPNSLNDEYGRFVMVFSIEVTPIFDVSLFTWLVDFELLLQAQIDETKNNSKTRIMYSSQRSESFCCADILCYFCPGLLLIKDRKLMVYSKARLCS